MQVQLKEVQIELNLYKSAASEGSSLTEVRLRNQLDSLSKDKLSLQEEIQVSMRLCPSLFLPRRLSTHQRPFSTSNFFLFILTSNIYRLLSSDPL